MNINKIYQISLAVCLMFLLSASMLAQTNKAKKDKKKAFEVSSVLTDEEGLPVKDAVILANEGAIVTYSDESGAFTVKTKENAFLLIEALGFEDAVVLVSGGQSIPEKIVMKSALVGMTKDDLVNLPMGVQEYRRNIVGAVTTIKGSDLETVPEPELSNTLQGRGMGLIARTNTGGMANNPAGLFLRGLHRDGNNQAITIVDGIERPIDDLMAEEIETIELLKDATAKILYGPRAANGVILVTTKTGSAHKKEIKVNVDYGVGTPTRMPTFIDSYNYVKLFNEARQNDGLDPYYSEADLQGYKNSKGVNDLYYPNVDAYDYFLRDYVNYTKIATEFSGGNEGAQYAVVLGYLGYGGLQDVGPRPEKDRFNIRGNLNVKVTNAISAYMGVAGRIDYWTRGGIDHSETFSGLSTHRPNEYPLVIEDENAPVFKKFPTLGGSFDRPGNIYGALAYGGDSQENYLNGQVNFGMNFDLDDLTEGLTAKTFVTFDSYFAGTRALNKSAATFARQMITGSMGQDSLTYIKVQNENLNTDYTLNSSQTLRNSGINGQLNYNRDFDGHLVNADMGFFYQKMQRQYFEQDIINTNGFLRLNYSAKNKYVAEMNLAMMGSNRFASDNRQQLSYAFGAGSILSEESFMQNVGFVDYLKLKASWGMLGYDATTSHYLYENRWYNNGNAQFGEKNSGDDAGRTSLDLIGNPNLGWEKSQELNLGLEAIFLRNKLVFAVNYFDELRYDIVQKVNAEYSAIYGDLIPYSNNGKVRNQGVEAEIQWNNRSGDFEYAFGANAVYSKNKLEQWDEVNYPDTYRRTVGLPTDAVMGYLNTGIFGKDVSLDGAPYQTFGQYGAGSLAYADLNNDNVIDDRDRQQIGNNFPRTSLGVDLDMKYKGFGLYVLGTAEMGVYTWKDNAYYRNADIGKYSDLAYERYHPVNNPNGTYPSLTTMDARNNFVGSDFWLTKSDFFRIKNVELSYTFRFREPTAIAKKLKVYARGTNLLVISGISDLDPEAINSGVNNYPVIATITGGVSVNF